MTFKFDIQKFCIQLVNGQRLGIQSPLVDVVVYILDNFGRDLVDILCELEGLLDGEALAVRSVKVEGANGVHVVHLVQSHHLLEATQLLHELLLSVFEGGEVALCFFLHEFERIAEQKLLDIRLDELIVHVTHGLLGLDVDACFELRHVWGRIALLTPFLQLSEVVEP